MSASSAAEDGLPTVEKPAARRGLHPAFYIASWIFFSNATILFNKWLIDKAGFKYPVTLTFWHMVFATLTTQVLARTTSLIDGRRKIKTGWHFYSRTILPIGLLYSGSLVCSNMVYLYLSVSFIQMLKAAAPVAVLLCAWAWRLKEPSARVFVNVCVIVFGVVVASLGEIQFSWMGLFYQMGGIVFEALRLTLIEVMLAGDADQRMDPLVSLYFYAPVCAVTNFLVAAAAELTTFNVEDLLQTGFGVLFLNALVAFLLNVSSVMLIGKTSGLVLTLTGILKNILLIFVAVILWSEDITFLQVLGYTLALGGLTYYSLGWDVIKTNTTEALQWGRAVFSGQPNPDGSTYTSLGGDAFRSRTSAVLGHARNAASAAVDRATAAWNSPQLDESRLSPNVRRGVIGGLGLLMLVMVAAGVAYGGRDETTVSTFR